MKLCHSEECGVSMLCYCYLMVLSFFTATHEKGFILYLSSSHVLFLLVLTIYYLVWPHLNAGQQKSYYKKLYIFLFSTFSLFLMAYFYYRHIRHCDALGE